jgi:hypothetical protein
MISLYISKEDPLMSETMADELGFLRWSPTSLPCTAGARDEWHGATTLGLSELPVMRPGQLWLVELPASAPEVAALEYRALGNANVIIYDRALAPTVARFLPLGGYAEPAASRDGQSGAESERCVRFVRDGWSVARLFYPGLQSSRERLDKIRQLSHHLLTSEMPADLPVQIFVSAARGRYDRTATQLCRMDAIIAACAPVQSSTFTIVLDVADTGGAPRFSVASANGLAG